MHAEAPGLVRSGADDRAIAQPGNDHRIPAQMRIIALLNRSVERVHVDMDDFSQYLTPKIMIPDRRKPNTCHGDPSVSITLLLDLRGARCVAATVCPDASK